MVTVMTPAMPWSDIQVEPWSGVVAIRAVAWVTVIVVSPVARVIGVVAPVMPPVNLIESSTASNCQVCLGCDGDGSCIGWCSGKQDQPDSGR